MEFTRSAFAPKAQVTTSEKRQKRSLVEDHRILVFDQIAAKGRVDARFPQQCLTYFGNQAKPIGPSNY